MEAFKAVFINEIEKMYRRKKAFVAVFIALLVIVMGQLAVTVIRNGFGIMAANGTVFPTMVLSLFVNIVLPLFTALVAIDMFSGEYSHNTMKITMVRPVSRFKMFSAKIAAIGFFVLVNLLFVMVLSILTGFLFNSVNTSVTGLLQIILSYVLTLFPVMAIELVVVFLSNIFKSGTTVFFISILFFIIFKGLGVAFPKYSSFFITSMLDWYDLWAITPLQIFKLLRTFLIITGYAIMFFTAGYYLFDKKDL